VARIAAATVSPRINGLDALDGAKPHDRSRGDDSTDCGRRFSPIMSGRKEEAIKIVNDLEVRHDQHPSADADIALIYVGLGDRDQAMISLNKACEAPVSGAGRARTEGGRCGAGDPETGRRIEEDRRPVAAGLTL
jgi:hypothetical protein